MAIPLQVTEWMKGYVGFGASDSDAGFIQGLDEGTCFEHEVLIQIDDIDRFVSEPAHTARVDGHILCDRLGGRREVRGGTFNMLVDSAHPGLTFMFYRMPFTDGDGVPHTVLGHKTIHDDHALDLWSDITTLTVRVFRGDVVGPDMTTPALGPARVEGVPRAIGVLHIQALDGIRSAASFRSPGASVTQQAYAVEKFCSFYLRRLWDLYGKVHPSQRAM